jgi:hypothetical protein
VGSWGGVHVAGPHVTECRCQRRCFGVANKCIGMEHEGECGPRTDYFWSLLIGLAAWVSKSSMIAQLWVGVDSLLNKRSAGLKFRIWLDCKL